ncbi:MAG TPA: phosphoribosylamine--glycine ligase [Gemmatimonadales bacterium]|nr:phosphoribosylamine--glycine ligase [Gemmatimonadales bacterium]
MRVLVVGGGGREHALCWALHRDAAASASADLTLFAAPGNPGTASLGTNLPIAATAINDIATAVGAHDIDVTIIGPEAPLALGLADRLRDDGRAVFGPSAAAARLESSKAYAKEVMRRAGVATAESATFVGMGPALAYIAAHAEPLVVKASGLAAGKGAVVCRTREEAALVVRAMLDGSLGEAGKEVLVEEFLEGEELSVLALTDGERVLLLPPAQDHKRLGEGDTGPNTGGMGAYCPVGIATEALRARVRTEIFEPVLREVAAQGATYEGVLYAGLMITPDGTPSVLEFNARFGDPETQVLLPALAPGVTKHLIAIAQRQWELPAESRHALEPERAAVTTVLAARGYPENPEKGVAIRLPPAAELGDDVIVFHAGTYRDNEGRLRTSGGRVLNVTGLGATVPLAARASREGAERISFAGMTWRRDVAWREIQRAGTT